MLLPIAARQPIGRLRDHADAPHDILLRVLERFHRRDFEAVRKLCAREPAPNLAAWLRVVLRHAAIDYMRENPEYVPGTHDREPRWISLASLVSTPGQPIDSLAEKRAAVLTFLREACARAEEVARIEGDDAVARLAAEWTIAPTHARRLIQRGRQHLQVLEAVLDGHSHSEVASRLALSKREVELAVRYIEEFLAARRFAEPLASAP